MSLVGNVIGEEMSLVGNVFTYFFIFGLNNFSQKPIYHYSICPIPLRKMAFKEVTLDGISLGKMSFEELLLD